MGYRINNFDVFGWGAKASRSKSKGGNKNAANKNASTTKTVQNGTNHDLNLRLDFSFRKQAAIVRDIASMVSSASSGNNAPVEQQLSYHNAGFRSEHQVLADEIKRKFTRTNR